MPSLGFGWVISCSVAKDEAGASKEHGFVQFEDKDDACKAMRATHPDQIGGHDKLARLCKRGGKSLYVGFFATKEERVAMITPSTKADDRPLASRAVPSARPPSCDVAATTTMYVTGLEERYMKQPGFLRALFASFGTVIGCDVQAQVLGGMEKCARVTMECEHEAREAVGALNGTTVATTPMYVYLVTEQCPSPPLH